MPVREIKDPRDFKDMKFVGEKNLNSPALKEKLEKVEPKVEKVEVEKLEKVPLKKEINTELKTNVRYIKTRTYEDSSFTRISLPSGCVFYDDVTDVSMREFSGWELASIHKAMQQNNFSLLVDAIGSTIRGIDIRDLTIRDFFFLMYHHRLNDYPTSPYTIPWTSRYGNQNKNEITKSDVKTNVIKMTEEEVKVYKELGITYPRVRDLEIATTEKLNEEESWLLERAQYFVGDDLGEKLNRAANCPVRELETIRKFSEESKHGVIESVWLTDQHFEPEKAIQHLKKVAIEVRQLASTIDINIDTLLDKAIEFEEEAKVIEEALKAGKKVLPAEEEVGLSIDALRFFPSI